MQQTVVGAEIGVNISRAVSRLKTIFCSFDGDFNPTTAEKVDHPYYLVKRPFNYFYHPMGRRDNDAEAEVNVIYDFRKELEYQIQIGAKQIPEYPCRSLSQAHSELKKALGILGSPWHSISPTYKQYWTDHFIIGIDCEKVLDASWTGLNTKAGDLLTIKLKGANATIDTALMPSKMYITLHSDNILEIRDSGASVYD